MKLNPDQFITGIGGVLLMKPAPESTPEADPAPWTVRDVLVNALMGDLDPKATGVVKYDRGKLAERIHEANGEHPAELTAEEVVTCKNLVGIGFTTAIIVPVWDILEGAGAETAG